jgi:uncharacterized protein (TIGR00251 family)
VSGPSTRLQLRVVPGASREEIVGRHGDAWKVRVTAPAEDGRANDAVLDLLAHTLDIPRRDVSVTVGASSRDKVVVLDGVTSELAEASLAAAVGGRR